MGAGTCSSRPALEHPLHRVQHPPFLISFSRLVIPQILSHHQKYDLFNPCFSNKSQALASIIIFVLFLVPEPCPLSALASASASKSVFVFKVQAVTVWVSISTSGSFLQSPKQTDLHPPPTVSRKHGLTQNKTLTLQIPQTTSSETHSSATERTCLSTASGTGPGTTNVAEMYVTSIRLGAVCHF